MQQASGGGGGGGTSPFLHRSTACLGLNFVSYAILPHFSEGRHKSNPPLPKSRFTSTGRQAWVIEILGLQTEALGLGPKLSYSLFSTLAEEGNHPLLSCHVCKWNGLELVIAKAPFQILRMESHRCLGMAGIAASVCSVCGHSLVGAPDAHLGSAIHQLCG